MIEIKSLKLEKIASDEVPFGEFVKMVAKRLMLNPYLSLGDFFKSLTTDDLTVLNFMVEMMETDGQCGEDMVVLTQMLSLAEGTMSNDDARVTKNVSYLANLVCMVSLEKKGLIELFYDNMSFGEDMDHLPVAKLKV